MNQETVINQTQKQEFASFNESNRTQTVFIPKWHSKIKDLKEKVTGSEVIMAHDINSKMAKNFAVFDSYESVLQYRDGLQKDQRMLYEWILPNRPARFIVDIDNETDHQLIGNPIKQMNYVESFLLRVIDVFQEMNIDCQNIEFKFSDSSRSDKFIVHIVSNYY